MVDYKKASKSKFTTNEERRFRRLFNRWGASVQGYDRDTLGDELKIIEVWDSPIYRGILKTQYDNRELGESYERVRGRSFPNSKYTHEHDIDRWALFEYPTTFTSRESSHRITGTEHITTCPTCNGRGKIPCEKCNGRGSITVTETKKEKCNNCDGHGYIYEQGYKEEKDYYYLNGNLHWRYKQVPCQRQKICYTCHGRGNIETTIHREVPCKNCHATGKVVCTTCNGDTMMVRYLTLYRRQETRQHTKYCFPTLIEESDALKMSRLFDNSTPWKHVEKIRVEKENFEQANIASRPIVGGMLSQLPKNIHHLQNTVICFNEFDVYECEAKTVIYEVDNTRYTCMLVGGDWKLFTVTSPVSEEMDSLKDKANNYCSIGLYGKAWTTLLKINKYPQAGENEARMLEQLEERMALVTKFGINIATVLCAILIAPIFFTMYEDFAFFAPWSAMMNDKFGLSPGFLMVVSIFFLIFVGIRRRNDIIPEYTYKVTSPLKRFVRGFIYGVGHSIFYTAIILICAYIGPLQIVAGLINLCIYIILFVIVIIMLAVKSFI